MPAASLRVLLVLLIGCRSEANLRQEREAPVADLSSPGDGEVLRQDNGTLTVLGTVSDSADAPDELHVTLTANGEQLAVSVDENGDLTAIYPLSGADLGELRFELLVVDTDGDAGQALAVAEVRGPLGPPTVEIALPADGAGYEPGETIAFQGLGSDTTTEPDDLTFDWSSDLDGELPGAISADGSSALITAALSLGTHLITLKATDEDGETGQDSITVTIAEPVEEPVDEEPTDEEPEEVLPGDVMFSEMNVNPEAVDDELGEWVELYNTASYAIDIGGYTFRDDDVDDFELLGPLVVESHGTIVLCASLDPLLNGGVPCDGWFERKSTGDGLALANGPDELVLARPDGLEIDWLYYDDTWFTTAVAIGVDPNHLNAGDNDDLNVWCDQTTVTPPMVEPGTPGAPNDDCP